MVLLDHGRRAQLSIQLNYKLETRAVPPSPCLCLGSPPYNPQIKSMPPFSPFSLQKKHTEAPPTSAPASGFASYQVTQQLQFPINSQSRSQSPQEKQRSQPVGPWSAHIPPSGWWPSPFPRSHHAISTTATAAGELYLFGGISNKPLSDLYVISTEDFSTTLLQTSGDIPSPRYGHRAMLTSTILLISGGAGDDGQCSDESLYLLNLGTSDIFHVKTCSS
jgi:hypothetical protein